MKKLSGLAALIVVGYLVYSQSGHRAASRNSPGTVPAASTYDAVSGLKGAVTDIPVYLPARVTDRIEGGDLKGTLHAYTWFLETPSDKKQVIAFYDRHLPSATRTPYNDGSAMWAYTPPGCNDSAGEGVTVLVTAEGKIEISESVLKQKRIQKKQT
jgi:hypothetical protein